jgi:hypothetical protein
MLKFNQLPTTFIWQDASKNEKNDEIYKPVE